MIRVRNEQDGELWRLEELDYIILPADINEVCCLCSQPANRQLTLTDEYFCLKCSVVNTTLVLPYESEVLEKARGMARKPQFASYTLGKREYSNAKRDNDLKIFEDFANNEGRGVVALCNGSLIEAKKAHERYLKWKEQKINKLEEE